MGVSSYFEFVTVLFGWIVYDRLWAVLNDTGIVYVPFFVILLKNMLESRRAGDDEGSAAVQSLKKSETDIVVAIVVMFLAAVPFTEVRPRPDELRAPDARLRGRGAHRPRRRARAGQRACDRHRLRRAARHALRAGRAHPDLVGVRARRLQGGRGGGHGGDPLHGRCGPAHHEPRQRHGREPAAPARARGFYDRLPPPGRAAHVHRRSAAGPSRRRARWTTWARRSSSTPTATTTSSTRAARARRFRRIPCGIPDWTGRTRPAASGGATAPTACARGCSRRSTGATRDELVYDPNAILRDENPGLSVAELEDLLLRRYLAHRSGDRIGVSSVSYEPGVAENYRMGASAHDRALTGIVHATGDVIDDVLSMGAAGLGMLLQGPGNVAAGVAIREGMPIFLALLLMVFVAVLPFLMVFSRYDPGVLVTLTLVFFGLQFFYVLWGMAFWADNHLLRGALRAGRGAEGEPHPGTGGAVGAALPLHRLPDGLARRDRLGGRQGRVRPWAGSRSSPTARPARRSPAATPRWARRRAAATRGRGR